MGPDLPVALGLSTAGPGQEVGPWSGSRVPTPPFAQLLSLC